MHKPDMVERTPPWASVRKFVEAYGTKDFEPWNGYAENGLKTILDHNKAMIAYFATEYIDTHRASVRPDTVLPSTISAL